MKRQNWALPTSIGLLSLLALAACGGADPGDEPATWGAQCREDAGCAAPTDYCVIQPGATEGYCTIRCPNLGSDCTFEDWTCNVIGACGAPAATWCGPPSEIEQSGGFLAACE